MHQTTTDLRATEREHLEGLREVPVEVVCDAEAARCVCLLDASDGHEVHACDCGGQWTGTNPDFGVVRLPRVFS